MTSALATAFPSDLLNAIPTQTKKTYGVDQNGVYIWGETYKDRKYLTEEEQKKGLAFMGPMSLEIISGSPITFKGPLNVIGEPDIIPCNFKKAITDPENVIAPTAAPIDISIRLPSLIFPGKPRLNAVGFKKAAIATKTAAKPTKL